MGGTRGAVNSPRDGSMGSPEPDGSTLPEDPSPGAFRREKWLREFTLLFVVSVVALGTFGVLGVRTSTAGSTGNGYRIEVTYAAVTRGGLATPLSIEVGTDDGSALPEVVTIRVASDYLALLDDNGMEPTPVSSFNSGGFTSWDFEVPPRVSTLEVVLDARLEPTVQWGEQGSAELWIDGDLQAAVEFRSRVMP